jgi:hypothetical protein
MNPSWFLEKINKADKLFKGNIVKTKINKDRNEKGSITTNASEIQRIIRE